MLQIRSKHPCPTCASLWVDGAIKASGARVPNEERRQLIIALLESRHLLLTGLPGTGKRRLAHALADSLCPGHPERVRTLRGHPWWAAQTGDVNRFVAAQMNYDKWRLEDFVADMVRTVHEIRRPNLAAQPAFVVIIENMSPVETDFYFHSFLNEWISSAVQGKIAGRFMLIGTLDAPQSPGLSAATKKIVTMVNLVSSSDWETDSSRNSKPRDPGDSV